MNAEIGCGSKDLNFFYLLWQQLLILLQLIPRDSGQLLVELKLGLGELGQVDDHEQVFHIGVYHAFEFLRGHLGDRVDQVEEFTAHSVVGAILTGEHSLDILKYIIKKENECNVQ